MQTMKIERKKSLITQKKEKEISELLKAYSTIVKLEYLTKSNSSNLKRR